MFEEMEVAYYLSGNFIRNIYVCKYSEEGKVLPAELRKHKACGCKRLVRNIILEGRKTKMLSLVICLLSFGGFYDFGAALTGIGIGIDLFLIYKKNTVYRKKNTPVQYLPLGLFLWMILVSFWAVDPAENGLGIFRGAVLLLWMYLCFLRKEEQKERLISLIPYMGSVMTVLGLCSLISERTAGFFWQAGRLGGFFQYPNTFALFLVIGIMILVQEFLDGCKEKRRRYVSMANLVLLLVGILLSGSRSMLLLLLLWGLYKALREKKLRRPVLLCGILVLLTAGAYVVIFKDKQNVGRIFTLFEANSTLYGRLLYYADACKLIAKKPFGLGYMGYHYMQPAIQNGIYTTRFVHNDWLQLLLDYGLIGGVLGGTYVVWQFVKGRQKVREKEIAGIILLASLVDFHLQYLCMGMLLLLCFDLGQKEKQISKKQKTENRLFMGALMAVFIYFAVPFLALYFGNPKLATDFFEPYTAAQISLMNTCTQKEEAVARANELLKRNPYIFEAYQVKVYGAVMDGDASGIIQNMDKALQISRYDTELYKQYDGILSDLVNRNLEAGSEEGTNELEAFRQTLPERLLKLKETTHPLAFKIRDVPTFSW